MQMCEIAPLRATRKQELRKVRPDCPIYEAKISSLSHYLQICDIVTSRDQPLWFRGHGEAAWSLTPSALRHKKEADRNKALELLHEFKRIAPRKLDRQPSEKDDLGWVQLARHYGLPTRLLDWTQNAAIGLYFACENPEKDGLVFILNPLDLNTAVDPTKPRVFDVNLDAELINSYLTLNGGRDRKGLKTIAINPVWNSERIMLQKGAFTLHGSRTFALNSSQAPSMVALPVLREFKGQLLSQLDSIGVDEMSIFPEPEHICNYLKRRAKLPSP